MKKQFSRGFTLVELLVTVLVSSIFFMIVGQLLIAAFHFGLQASKRMEAENNATYFQRMLEYQFRSTDYANLLGVPPVTILSGGVSSPSGDTLRFASYMGPGNLLNSYTKNEYKVVGGNLVRIYLGAAIDEFGIQPGAPWNASGWGSTLGTTQIMMTNVVSVQFAYANMDSVVGTNSCITVTVVSGLGADINTNTFTVTSWNGGRL